MARFKTEKILSRLEEAGLIAGYRKLSRKYEDSSRSYEQFQVTRGSQISVTHEVYGEDARMYVYANCKCVAEKAAGILREMGASPNFNWQSTMPDRFEVPVAYFRGWHHWE